jgi:putative ABC transport system permease protein
MNIQKPPVLADKLLTWFCKDELLEEIQGDLLAHYQKTKGNKGKLKASMKYWFQVFHFLRPFALKRVITFKITNTDMFQNYAKIAWRNLLRYKTYSTINILGLSVGIASFLIMALYIYDEMTFDSMHSKREQIFRVIASNTNSQGITNNIAATSYQISEQGGISVPEVKNAVRLFSTGRSRVSPLTNEANSFYEPIYFANPGFLETFDFKLLHGNALTALKEPNSVILTRDMAMKLFMSTEVIGKYIISDRDSVPYNITGVLENFPTNSHLSFNLLYSEASLRDARSLEFIQNDWDSNYFSTYLLLDKHSDPVQTAQALNDLATANTSEEFSKSNVLWLQPFNDIHFNSAGIEQGLETGGNKASVIILLVAALFVLLIASINYMNLTTARFSTRSKEIGVRKVSGANRSNLFGQLLTESMFITFISFVLGILLVKLALPFFNNYIEKELVLGPSSDIIVWLSIGVIMLLVGVISGIYPAFIQSKQHPSSLLKTKISLGKGTVPVRQGLVVFQFTLSIIMIASTIIMYRQLDFINTKDLGFNKEQLVVVDINSGLIRNNAQTIKNQFLAIPSVEAVATSSRVPGEWKQIPQVKILNSGADISQSNDMYFLGVDEDFFATFDIALKNGQNFVHEDLEDSSSLILNETAATLLGIDEASNQLVNIPSVDFYGNIRVFDQVITGRVKGIVKDFNYMSLRDEIAPMVMAPSNNPIHRIDYFVARLDHQNMEETLGRMEGIIHSVDESHIFEYNFLDKKWDLFYKDDQRKQSIFIVIALLTIFIACLGLFGLTTFISQQRTKEIGIRKVLGANISSLAILMSKDFLKLVLIAIFLATPIAWFFLDRWLQDFAFRIDISVWMFVLAGAMAILLAVLTISYQSIKAALRNPVETLRTE